jgi:hypothetical protein
MLVGRDDAGGAHEGGLAERHDHRRLRGTDFPRLVKDDGIGECQRLVRRPDTIVRHLALLDGAKVVAVADQRAARTEQPRTAGGSVNALVEGGEPGAQQLNLGMVYGAVFAREVADAGSLR